MDQFPALPASHSPSPFRPLFLCLGPLFALTNVSLFPLLCLIVSIAFSGLFGSSPPPPGKAWLPLLIGVELTLVAFIPAQALLLTLCLTWSSGNLWRRLGTYWLGVLTVVGCVLAGVPLYWLLSAIHAWATGELEWAFGEYGQLRWNFDNEAAQSQLRSTLAAVCCLPMMLLGVQMPFWVIRMHAGCRLVRESPGGNGSAEPEPVTQALSIRDLFLATALVAVSMSLLQFADRIVTQQESEAQAMLFGDLLATAVCLLVSLFTAVPLVFLFFSRYSLQLCWGATLFSAGACAVAIFAIAQSIAPTSSPLEQFGTICALAFGYSAGSAAGLTLLRRSGWRLVTRNRRY